MNYMTAGDHFVSFILRGHGNSPKGANDPKIPLKHMKDKYLTIQTLKLQGRRSK